MSLALRLDPQCFQISTKWAFGSIPRKQTCDLKRLFAETGILTCSGSFWSAMAAWADLPSAPPVGFRMAIIVAGCMHACNRFVNGYLRSHRRQPKDLRQGLDRLASAPPLQSPAPLLLPSVCHLRRPSLCEYRAD